jgi:hypothetical protein
MFHDPLTRFPKQLLSVHTPELRRFPGAASNHF